MSFPFRKLLKRSVKFGASSAIATTVDFTLFRFVFYNILPLFYAEILASFIGMIINFFLQKKYVFNLKRKTSTAFILSISSSIAIMLFGGIVITQITKIDFLGDNISIAKIIVIGLKFSLNFFIKHWVFEKKIIDKD